MKESNTLDIFDVDDLKPLEKIFVEDERNGVLVRMPSGESVNLQWHYEQISKIVLSDKVYNDIKAQFETAKNVYLYSWFAYRMAMVSWLHAFSTLELTLRLVAEAQGYKVKTLRRLLEKANVEGWVDFDAFVKTKNVEEYIHIQCEFRNKLSHGSHMLLSPDMILPFLSDCAHMINEVFEKDLLAHNDSSVRDGWE